MVRIGGGWEKIDDYISRNQESELAKLDRIMNDTGKSYNNVILDLLAKYGADTAIVT